MRCIISVSQLAASPMACGNTVASPARATPCSASFQKSYAAMFSRGIAGAPFWPRPWKPSCICRTFSSSVMRETRSAARCSAGRSGFIYAGVCAHVAAPSTLTRNARADRLVIQEASLVYCCTIERSLQIRDIRATTVTVPLEAPLRHANGCHWGRFVRTIVEVETDNGLIGLGEMGGGGESAEAVFQAMKAYLVGHNPARLEEMRFLIANPTASLYNNRTQVLAALEFACLDILGQAWGVPVCDILGGRLRDRVPFAAYCFFRYPNPRTGEGEVRTIEQVLANAADLKRRFGFTTHKLKGGVFHPDYELECYRALAAAFPEDSLRFDPNAVWSTEQAIRFGNAIKDLRNDYLEDPVFG